MRLTSQTAIFFTQSPDSNVNLIQKQPHRNIYNNAIQTLAQSSWQTILNIIASFPINYIWQNKTFQFFRNKLMFQYSFGVRQKNDQLCNIGKEYRNYVSKKKSWKNKSEIFKFCIRYHIYFYSRVLDGQGPILKEQNKRPSHNSLSIRNQG
jgi:hypothetical protein